LPVVAAALLLLLVAARRWRRGPAEFGEADRLAAARSVTSLPYPPSAAERE
jgi:hypothetical protein